MIGKLNFATAGIRFQSNGNSDFTRDDGNVININRTTSNGSLIGFYQDGTEEGTYLFQVCFLSQDLLEHTNRQV